MNIAQRGQYTATQGLFQFSYFEAVRSIRGNPGNHPVFYDHQVRAAIGCRF
jgi:hypothetical protein